MPARVLRMVAGATRVGPNHEEGCTMMSGGRWRYHLVSLAMALAFWIFIIGAFWLVELAAPTPRQQDRAVSADQTGCVDRMQDAAGGAECAE